MRLSSFALLASSLILTSGCGQTSTRETPTPAPTAASSSLIAYAETATPGTLTVFDVDDRNGRLTVKGEVAPSGTAEAPVVSPGSFAIHPDGKSLFYSYDSCRVGWCGNVASYAILPDAALRLLAHEGPASVEGGMEVLFATTRRLVVHVDDAPWHSIAFYNVDPSGGLTHGGGISLSYGFANVPRPFKLTRSERWGHGLTKNGLVSYRLNEYQRGVETATESLPGLGRGLEMDPEDRFLYVALEATPPRIDVYAIDDSGRRDVVGTFPVGGAGPLLLDPSGRLLFLATSAGLEVYGVDPASGYLTRRGQEPISEPDSMSIHPSGTFLYVSQRDGALRGYSIAAGTGALTDIGMDARGRRLQFARIEPAAARADGD